MNPKPPNPKPSSVSENKQLVSRAGRYINEVLVTNFAILDDLLREASDDTKQREQLTRLYAGNLRLLRFMNLYTSYGMYKYSEPDYRPRNTDISSMLREMCSKCAEILDDIDFTVEIKRRPSVTVADAEKLKQAVLCLISNAVRHCQSRVVISLEEDETSVKISVYDDGPELDEKQRLEIETAMKHGVDEYDGSGMGLVLASMIVAVHDGKLLFLPAADGNTFEIVLPIKTDDCLHVESGSAFYSRRFCPEYIELCDYSVEKIIEMK